MKDWVACPHCGERIDRDATACRYCGSDDRTGWSEATYLDGIDIPEPDDYEEGLQTEGFRKPKSDKKGLMVAGVSSVLILLFVFWLLWSLR